MGDFRCTGLLISKANLIGLEPIGTKHHLFNTRPGLQDMYAGACVLWHIPMQ
jgi:hypothetical protein